jgi:hypothetical protein
MSMLFGPASSDPAVSGLPRGEVLGTYDSYADARKVVDRLAEQEFDVRTVSIVGVDLRTVERIRNRLTYASVALRSALQGAFFGLMLGILMSLIDPSGAGFQMLYTVGLGVGIWVLFGVIGHAIRKGRGFDSVQQLVPTRFDVVCEFASAPTARQILGGGAPAPAPATAPRPAAPTSSQQPPSAVPAGPVSGAGSSVSGGAVAPAPPETGSPDQDPASAPPASTASSAGSAAAPTPAAGLAPTPASAPTPGRAPARTHHLPDLPDGRPQYGVRLPQDEAQALRERILKDQAGQSGAAASTFEAPDYGRGRGRRTDPSRPVDGGAAVDPASGSTPGEDTADAAPASGATDERFARPRYGRHAGGPDAPRRESGAASGSDPASGPEPASGPVGEPGHEEPEHEKPAGNDPA